MESYLFEAGGVAHLTTGGRYTELLGDHTLNPANLTCLEASSTVAHVPFSPSEQSTVSLHLAQGKYSDTDGGTGTTSDSLLPFLDPALGGNATIAPALASQRGAHVGKRTDSQSTSASTATRSSRGSKNGDRLQSITPLTALSPEDSAPRPPKKRTKKSKPAAEATKAEAMDGEKRDQFLERNRVAASKCRKKKKAWMTELEEAKQSVERQHTHLRTEYNGLLNEVGELKNMLMSHASCKNANIDRWIDNEAKRFVQSTNRRLERAGYGSSRPQNAGHRPSLSPSAFSPTGSESSFGHSPHEMVARHSMNDLSQAQASSTMDVLLGHELGPDTSGFGLDLLDTEQCSMPLGMFSSTVDDCKT